MDTHEQIVRQKQCIARCENSLALEKLKKRRADTRRKIELGGLVIKSTLDGYAKSVVLGALLHVMQLIENDKNYLMVFESIGNGSFLKK